MGASNKVCPNCGRKMKQQFIGLRQDVGYVIREVESCVSEHNFRVLRGSGQRPNKHETGGFRVNGSRLFSQSGYRFSAFVLHRMDSLLCRWARCCASEPSVSLCADAVGGVPGAVLFVRRPLAAQYSGCDHDDDFRRGASDSVHPIISLIRIFPNPS